MWESSIKCTKITVKLLWKKLTEKKNLGVVFDSKLLFRENIASKIKIANRNLGRIFRSFTLLIKRCFYSYINLYK